MSGVVTVVKIEQALPTGSNTIGNVTLNASSAEIGNVKIVDSNSRIAIIDGVTYAQVNIAFPHHEIHEGNHFFIHGSTTINNGANLDFLFVTPNTTKWAHALWEFDGEFELTFSLYESVSTSNNGTPVTIFNNNRNSATTATVLGFTGPTLTSGALGYGGNGGISIWPHKIGSGKKLGGEASRDHELIAKQNTKYWFRINNASGSNSWVNYDFSWYEHTSIE